MCIRDRVGTACGLAMTGACGRGTAGVACGCWVAAGCVNIGFMTCLGLCPLAIDVYKRQEHGHFRLIPFRQKSNGLEHVALFKGTWAPDEPVLVRVNSSFMLSISAPAG